MLIHCVACLVYKAPSLPPNTNLPSLITSLIEYSIHLNEYYSKKSIDWLLCALFHKQPSLISTLTDLIDLSSLSTTTPNQRFLSLIETLSFGIQSPEVVHTVINSVFFIQLVQLVQKLINQPDADSDTHILLLQLLKVFTSIAEFQYGQNWLCNDPTGASIWQGIIHLLCSTSPALAKLTHTVEMSGLVIKLIKKMLFCNQQNQRQFALYLTDLIKLIVSVDKQSTLSGFLNQLILQVFLEEQTLTVNFQRRSSVFKIACNSSLGLLTHPRYGTGSSCRCVEVSLLRTCTEIINSISDIPIAQIISREKLIAKATSSSSHSSTENEMSDILANFKNYSESLVTLEKTAASAAKHSGDGKHTVNGMSGQMNETGKLRLYLKVGEKREICLPSDMTLWNVLRLYLSQTKADFVRDLTLSVQLSDGGGGGNCGVLLENNQEMVSENIGSEQFEMLNSYVISSPLDEFVKCDGLITLAERLPILMPFIQVCRDYSFYF